MPMMTCKQLFHVGLREAIRFSPRHTSHTKMPLFLRSSKGNRRAVQKQWLQDKARRSDASDPKVKGTVICFVNIAGSKS